MIQEPFSCGTKELCVMILCLCWLTVVIVNRILSEASKLSQWR